MTTKNSAASDRLADALKVLEEGIHRLTTSEEWERYLKIQAAFHQYSFANTMLILAQRPDATRVAGFKTWVKLGRHVRKGEKALWVLAPRFAKKTDQILADDGGEAEASRDQEAERVIYFRPVPVFDLSQTEGEDLPTPVRKLNGDTSGDLFDRLQSFSESNGCPVSVREFDGTANGYYEPEAHAITVRASLGTDQKAKTLAHEVAHSILHRAAETYVAHRGDCELEAESVAFVVLNHFGVDCGSYSFGYVSSWKGGGDEAIKSLKACARRIQETARLVIDGISADAAIAEVEDLAV